MASTGRNLSWERRLDCKNLIIGPNDTISRLPEDVKLHITTFLSAEDKDHLRSLSKSWRLLCSKLRKTLKLKKLRLDEDQFSTILEDYFPSVELFQLSNCSGIEHLKLVSHNLREVKLYRCVNLKKVKLTAPNLERIDLTGSLRKPCIVESGVSMHLHSLHLVGAYIDETVFSHCDTTFPVLYNLTIDGGHYMSDRVTISSSSLRLLTIFGFKKPVDITIDAPELYSVVYKGHLIATLSNLNLTRLKEAKIELKPKVNHERDSLWFQKLVDMINGFKPDDILMLITNSEKNIIIPKELRRSIVPLLRGPKAVWTTLDNQPKDNVDLIDAMLWFSPQAEDLEVRWKGFLGTVMMRHSEILSARGHPCCALDRHVRYCWRHSLVECILSFGDEDWKSDMICYIKENIENFSDRDFEDEIILEYHHYEIID